MLKRKSVWYVVLRACREKLKSLVYKMGKVTPATLKDVPEMVGYVVRSPAADGT